VSGIKKERELFFTRPSTLFLDARPSSRVRLERPPMISDQTAAEREEIWNRQCQQANYR